MSLRWNDMAPTRRDHVFQLRISKKERRQLEALADLTGLSAADLVRQLIRERYNERAEEMPKRKKE